MPSEDRSPSGATVAGVRGVLFPVLIVAAVLVLVAPLPPVLMDLLLACNITAAVVILLTAVYVGRPRDFSAFPAILLASTLVRLVLNVASTRLILSQAATQGTAAAGGVIEAFGTFVSAGNLLVGLILFAILITIQFLVITKGATRISEVAARFVLDGLPGKQMAIDADRNAGVINQAEAQAARAELNRQADFYGAMDGASKFVRGDAVASLLITAINILGGLYLGMVEFGMDLGEAVSVFTRLTIGDGLVTQVPAVLISLAAGLLVTRTSSESHLPSDVVGQLVSHPEALFLAGLFVACLSLTALPTAPLLFLAAGCALAGLIVNGSRDGEAAARDGEQNDGSSVSNSDPKPDHRLLVEPVLVELGSGLIGLADDEGGGSLLERLSRLRDQLAEELGIILPKVRIRAGEGLKRQQYRIKVRDVPVAWGTAYVKALFALETSESHGRLPGLEAAEPVSGEPGKWIEPAERRRAESLGYQLLEPSAVLMRHLAETVRNHSDELLSQDDVHHLLETLQERSPRLVKDVIPGLLSVRQLQRVLCHLLAERTPIRNLEAIVETLGDYAPETQDPKELAEHARAAVNRSTQPSQSKGTSGVVTRPNDHVAPGRH